jgi:polysaccharide export outer membrane protein
VGDYLRISVWKGDEYSGEFQVAADGTLSQALYQSVRVAGLTPQDVQGRLKELLSNYQPDPELTVGLLLPVSVGGAVDQSNLYRVPQGSTVAGAIALAGGATEQADLTKVRVLRGGVQAPVDLTSELSDFGNIPLESGDQISVGRRSGFNWVSNLLVPLVSLGSLAVSIATLVRLGEP